MSKDCVFCKIISKEIPSSIVKETDDILVIKDIAPKAPIHYLIIPKKHFQDLNSSSDSDMSLLGQILLMPKVLSKEFSIPDYRLVINNGKEAGQKVFHFHMHFLSKKYIGDL